jgi:DNA-directed RNA polymerase specialized sigma24 family protein
MSELSLPTIRSQVRRFVRLQEADVEDIVMTIVTKCLAGHFLPTRKMIHNVCIDHLRSKNREEKALLGYSVVSKEWTKPHYKDYSVLAELISKSCLLPTERAVILLRFYENYSIPSIAMCLKTNTTYVRRELQAAIEKIYLTAKGQASDE